MRRQPQRPVRAVGIMQQGKGRRATASQQRRTRHRHQGKVQTLARRFALAPSPADSPPAPAPAPSATPHADRDNARAVPHVHAVAAPASSATHHRPAPPAVPTHRAASPRNTEARSRPGLCSTCTSLPASRARMLCGTSAKPCPASAARISREVIIEGRTRARASTSPCAPATAASPRGGIMQQGKVQTLARRLAPCASRGLATGTSTGAISHTACRPG